MVLPAPAPVMCVHGGCWCTRAIQLHHSDSPLQVVVRESDISFVLGPDGQPISLGERVCLLLDVPSAVPAPCRSRLCCGRMPSSHQCVLVQVTLITAAQARAPLAACGGSCWVDTRSARVRRATAGEGVAVAVALRQLAFVSPSNCSVAGCLALQLPVVHKGYHLAQLSPSPA